MGFFVRAIPLFAMYARCEGRLISVIEFALLLLAPPNTPKGIVVVEEVEVGKEEV